MLEACAGEREAAAASAAEVEELSAANMYVGGLSVTALKDALKEKGLKPQGVRADSP